MRDGSVIVGVDPARPEHRDAIAFGALLARAADAPLLLVSVYETRHDSRSEARPYEHALEAASRSFARSLSGLEVHRLAAPGPSAAGVLHMLADQRDAFAVIIGSSVRANWGQVALGEVGQRLVHGGRSPVAVVPRGYASRSEGLEPIGVGYAGTPESEDAVRLGADIAARADISLQVITAFEPTDYAHAMAATPDDDLRERATDQLMQAVGSVERASASARLIDGDPAETLNRESRELGLLVVGSRSYGPLRAVLLGKVSGQLLLHAACPVMIVPHSPDRGHEVTLLGGLEAPGEST